MPFTPNEIKTIKNHMPHIINEARLFISVAESKITDEKEMYEYLIALIDQMELELTEIKVLTQSKLP